MFFLQYETKMNLIRKAMEDHASECAAEAEKIKAEFRAREHQLETVEKEAEDFLRVYSLFFFLILFKLSDKQLLHCLTFLSMRHD